PYLPRHRHTPDMPSSPTRRSSDLKSPYQAIVAFSGEHEYGGAKVTEASLNGFPSSQIADKIQADPYRFLICADKFQTGYDEPLLDRKSTRLNSSHGSISYRVFGLE